MIIVSINQKIDLKCCPNNDFFSTELIKITSNITSAEMLISSCYFTLSKLRIKCNECFKFYHIILLSGDVSLNPGPSPKFKRMKICILCASLPEILKL